MSESSSPQSFSAQSSVETQSSAETQSAAEPSPQCGDRSLFPQLEAKAYLNHAAISPVCTPVRQAVLAALDEYARHGVAAFPRWEERRGTLRTDIARLIGAEPDEIALGWNTSRGLTDVALAIPWRPKQRVLLLTGEFPANITPWQRAAELFDLELVFLDANAFATDAGLDQLQLELERGLRLVAVSAVQFQTGLRMPLQQIGERSHAAGAEVCVDAIQACGAVPLDVRREHIDYLATGGHKWLLGTEGAGFIYVRRECAERLTPATAGWLSHEDPLSFLFRGAGFLSYDRPLRREASAFETGTSSLLGLASLGASVPMLLGLGVTTIYEHLGDYLDRLESELIARGFTSYRNPLPDRRSCILSVEAPDGIDTMQFSAALRTRGVIVGTPDGKCRFAPHFANSLDEIAVVVEATDDALGQLRATL